MVGWFGAIFFKFLQHFLHKNYPNFVSLDASALRSSKEKEVAESTSICTADWCSRMIHFMSTQSNLFRQSLFQHLSIKMLPHMVASYPTFPQCAAYLLVASMPHNNSISFGALIVNVHVQLARYANIDQNNLLFLRYQIINTQQSWTDLWCDHFP